MTTLLATCALARLVRGRDVTVARHQRRTAPALTPSLFLSATGQKAPCAKEVAPLRHGNAFSVRQIGRSQDKPRGQVPLLKSHLVARITQSHRSEHFPRPAGEQLLPGGSP